MHGRDSARRLAARVRQRQRMERAHRWEKVEDGGTPRWVAVTRRAVLLGSIAV
ncbi:hypothetical protein GCM10022270_28060 [Terriglobus aquaticus]